MFRRLRIVPMWVAIPGLLALVLGTDLVVSHLMRPAENPTNLQAAPPAEQVIAKSESSVPEGGCTPIMIGPKFDPSSLILPADGVVLGDSAPFPACE